MNEIAEQVDQVEEESLEIDDLEELQKRGLTRVQIDGEGNGEFLMD